MIHFLLLKREHRYISGHFRIKNCCLLKNVASKMQNIRNYKIYLFFYYRLTSLLKLGRFEKSTNIFQDPQMPGKFLAKTYAIYFCQFYNTLATFQLRYLVLLRIISITHFRFYALCVNV